MKLGFLVYDLHLKGGGERVVSNLSNYFSEHRDCDITIISVAENNRTDIFPLNRKVNVHYLDVKRDGKFNKFANKIDALCKVRKYFDEYDNYDIVLGIGTYPNVLLSFVKTTGRTALVGCEHGAFHAVPFPWRILMRMRYLKLNALVSLTQRDMPYLLKLNPHVTVIPNGTPIRPIQPAELVNKRILAVGRLSFEKGYDYLIEVFSRFAKQNNDWHLRIAGDGPLRNILQKWIEERNLTDRVELAGNTDQVTQEYLSSSIFILTSRNEGLPMAMIEAQACGLPIVAFDIETGPSDIIQDNVDGFLIEPFNIDKMVNALLYLTNNNEKCKEFGLNGMRRSARFSEETVNEKWGEFLSDLAKDNQ